MPSTFDDRVRRLQEAISPTYTIEEQIGEGGMAQVYRAVNNQLGGKVAIKVLNAQLAKDSSIVNRFVLEARLQSRLKHPNIVWVFDIEQSGDLHYFFMPYIEGEDLEARMRRSPMEVREILDVAIQVTSALQCAHESPDNVVHRDLKPSNIRFQGQDTAMVMDFGIARVRSFGSKMTSLNMLIGTPPWMSPEQWLVGQPGAREVDGRTDFYSLGVILYELFTRRNPFYGESPEQTKQLHLTYTPPSLISVLPGMDPVVSQIIDRMLEKDAYNRHGSAAELLNDLKAARERRTGTPPPGSWESATKPVVELLNAIPHPLPDIQMGRQLTPNERELMKFVDGVNAVEHILASSSLPPDEAQRALGSLRKDALWLDIPLHRQ